MKISFNGQMMGDETSIFYVISCRVNTIVYRVHNILLSSPLPRVRREIINGRSI